jgi:hypothetical protein
MIYLLNEVGINRTNNFSFKQAHHILELFKRVQMQGAQKAGREKHSLKRTSLHTILLFRENWILFFIIMKSRNWFPPLSMKHWSR